MQPLPTLTAFRAIAASGVVLVHLRFFTTETAAGDLVHRLAYVGQQGVAFFFILSGAVLAYNYAARDESALAARTFYRRRIARIYPVYLVSLGAGLSVLVASDGAGALHAKTIAENLLMVQTWFPEADLSNSIPITAWSLSCEAFFYLCFPLLLPPLRRLSPRAAGWVFSGSLVLALILPPIVTELSDGNRYLLAPLTELPKFVCGCLIGCELSRRIAQRIPIMRGNPWPLLGSLVVAAAACAVILPSASRAIVASDPLTPFFCLAIVAAAALDVRSHHALSARWLVLGGLWSYCFYSFHVPILDLPKSMLGDPPTGIVGIAMALVLVAGVWLVSGAGYRWFEEPLRERLSRHRPSVAVLGEAD